VKSPHNWLELLVWYPSSLIRLRLST